MKITSATFILLFNFVLTCSLFGQEASSGQNKELTPSYGFPSVAVVKLDDKNVLQILLPSATVPVPNGAIDTIQYAVEENGVQVLKERTRTAYLPDKFRMIRTQLSIDKITLRDLSGKALDIDQLSKSIQQPTYVILCEGGSINSSRQHYFREDVLVMSPADLDPNCWYLPEVVGLAPKWIRTEPIPKPAVAQLVENGTKLEVAFIQMEHNSETRTEMRTRREKLADSREVEHTVRVAAPIFSTSKELIDLDECIFTTADGKEIVKHIAIERLLQPSHILWESNITEYLGSVMKPETLIVNRKSNKTNNAR